MPILKMKIKIEKKQAWKNQKCNACSKRIFIKKEEENQVYFLCPQFASPEKTWKLCEKCFKEIFGEEK